RVGAGYWRSIDLGGKRNKLARHIRKGIGILHLEHEMTHLRRNLMGFQQFRRHWRPHSRSAPHLSPARPALGPLRDGHPAGESRESLYSIGCGRHRLRFAEDPAGDEGQVSENKALPKFAPLRARLSAEPPRPNPGYPARGTPLPPARTRPLGRRYL